MYCYFLRGHQGRLVILAESPSKNKVKSLLLNIRYINTERIYIYQNRLTYFSRIKVFSELAHKRS